MTVSPLALPTDRQKLISVALDIVGVCRADVGSRAAYYRNIAQIVETGRESGTRSLINLMFSNLDRLAAHLFSPTDLRFVMEFYNKYDKQMYMRGAEAARILTAEWESSGTDMTFGQGVFEGLKYGCCILKQWPETEGNEQIPVHKRALIMPWQIGVYNPQNTSLDAQYAICETILLTLPEVWRRIAHFPDAKKMYDRIQSHAQGNQSNDEYGANLISHQVLSTAQLNTSGVSPVKPTPGGAVQMNGGNATVAPSPIMAAQTVRMHEIWVQDEDDYTTIQLIEPDILIAPLFKKANLLVNSDRASRLQPYNVIRPNEVAGNFWGRSEIVDLIAPQEWLSVSADDAQRLLNVQVDKFLAISGDGISDEIYEQARASGYLNSGAGANVTDLTPKFPPELLPMMKFQMEMIDRISGFDNMMSGRGEPGVRAGNQAATMMKAASPRLRDRSLLVERQCAEAADKWFSVMQAKDGRNYWTDEADVENSSFLLSDLPDDRRITVDSHSSSPIFADDHQQLVAFGLKTGMLSPEEAVELLQFPNKDRIIIGIKERAKKQQAMIQELMKRDPMAAEKLMAGKGKR